MDTKEFLLHNNHIIERFKDIAPGTYRHCCNVAQLCEPVAKELAINSDTLILAATLHDIGKCTCPINFIENQVDDNNPHDKLDPAISFQLLSRHLSDSVLKLIQMNAPIEVIRIVSEHHGNTLIKSIFTKAKEVYKGNAVEEHYKYKSAKPSSVESCVLMCCDVVESACRALSNAGKLKDYKSTVEKLMLVMSEEEQIDILSLGQLRTIKKVLSAEIGAIYHKRVDYEEVSIEK